MGSGMSHEFVLQVQCIAHYITALQKYRFTESTLERDGIIGSRLCEGSVVIFINGLRVKDQ